MSSFCSTISRVSPVFLSFCPEKRRRLFSTLLDLVRTCRLRSHPHEELRRELLGLEVTETAAGWRVDYKAGRFDDHVIAVALGASGSLSILQRKLTSRMPIVEPTAKAAVGRLLTETASELARSGAPRGSMLVLSGMNCSAASLQSELAQRRASMQALLKARIDRGMREGELPPGTDTTALTDFYATVLQGMSIQARDGATRKRLLATAEAAMRLAHGFAPFFGDMA